MISILVPLLKRIFAVQLLLILVSFCSLNAQISLETIELPRQINETSGLEIIGDNFVTFNDSGGESELYFFDKTGRLTGSAVVHEAHNVDWEDICSDPNYYYIADTGNNYGKRRDQKIYRLNRNLILKDSITLSYAAQKSFKRRMTHPFDAEALADFNDSLILFSKDRSTNNSAVYQIAKQPGHQVLVAKDSLYVECLITGADFHKDSGLMGLTGYSKGGSQFLFLMPDYSVPYDQSKMERYVLPVMPAQIEAIHIESPSAIWLTSEDEGLGLPRLFKVVIN
ncbi:MAG: hypothetical protein ACPGGF_02900 [Flavobacteriaceae bacterium]